MILCSVSLRVQVHSWVARELLPENLTKFSTLILYQTNIPSTGKGWFGVNIYAPVFVLGFFFFRHDFKTFIFIFYSLVISPDSASCRTRSPLQRKENALGHPGNRVLLSICVGGSINSVRP